MGDQAALDGPTSLAMTAAEYLRSPDLQAKSVKAFAVADGLF